MKAKTMDLSYYFKKTEINLVFYSDFRYDIKYYKYKIYFWGFQN